jgi:hypothetical protein
MELDMKARKRAQLVGAMTLSIAVGLFSMITISAHAQSSQPPKATDLPSYVPSVSDLMIATIQPRHVRLWLAVKLQNWEFANYELGNLKGAFRRAGVAHPFQNEIPLQDMIISVTQEPVADLEKAIKAKDSGLFAKAYTSLTAACNSCHEAVNHGEVMIRVPDESLVQTTGDLDLSPRKF